MALELFIVSWAGVKLDYSPHTIADRLMISLHLGRGGVPTSGVSANAGDMGLAKC